MHFLVDPGMLSHHSRNWRNFARNSPQGMFGSTELVQTGKYSDFTLVSTMVFKTLLAIYRSACHNIQSMSCSPNVGNTFLGSRGV